MFPKFSKNFENFPKNSKEFSEFPRFLKYSQGFWGKSSLNQKLSKLKKKLSSKSREFSMIPKKFTKTSKNSQNSRNSQKQALTAMDNIEADNVFNGINDGFGLISFSLYVLIKREL